MRDLDDRAGPRQVSVSNFETSLSWFLSADSDINHSLTVLASDLTRKSSTSRGWTGRSTLVSKATWASISGTLLSRTRGSSTNFAPKRPWHSIPVSSSRYSRLFRCTEKAIAGNDPHQASTVWLDRAFGMGKNTREMIQGYDCPADALYLPATIHGIFGTSTRKNAICVYERDSGKPLTRHTGWVKGEMGATKGYELLVRSISTVGNVCGFNLPFACMKVSELYSASTTTSSIILSKSMDQSKSVSQHQVTSRAPSGMKTRPSTVIDSERPLWHLSTITLSTTRLTGMSPAQRTPSWMCRSRWKK